MKKTQTPQEVEHTSENPQKGSLKRNRIQVQFDIEYGGTPGTNPKGKSDTVPDLNLTVRQLLQNHTRGEGSEVKVSEPIYFDQEIPTITDITDVEEYKEQLKDRLDQVNQFIVADKEKADQIKAEQKAAQNKKIQTKKDLQRGQQMRLDDEADRLDAEK
tara:strand:- start:2554 stop:3030 length:477 start_codon:yes stop_codon:yes gene_type:complete